MKNHNFFADGYVARNKYPSAIVLENYLKESNNPSSTKWVKKILSDYCISIKNLRNAKFVGGKEFVGKLILNHFISIVDKANRPDKCKSLVKNVIKTKFKIEILGLDKYKFVYGALGILSKEDAKLEKIVDSIKELSTFEAILILKKLNVRFE